MKPFSVFCETCGAKLKVRDPDVVGQIHMCPTCDSMVMIAVPASLLNPESAPAANTTSPELVDGLVAPSDFGSEIDDLLTTPADDPPVDTPVESVADEAIDTAIAEAVAEDTVPVESPMDEPIGDELIAEESATTSGGQWINMAVTIGGSIACFGLGLLAAWWVVGGNDSDEPQQVAVTESPSEVQPTTDETQQAVEVQKPVTSQLLPEEQATPPVEEKLEEPVDETEEVSADILPDLPPIAPERETPEEDSTSDPVKDYLPMLQPLDPLSIDSANLDLLLIPDDAPVEEQPTPPVETVAPVPPTNPQPQPPQVAPAPRDLRFEPGSASRGPSFSEQVSEGKLEVRLDGLLPAISWRNAPLHVALRELSQLSGVPITIDPTALRMAGISASQPVSVDASEESVRNVAAALAAKVKLVPEPSPAGLVLSSKTPDRWWNHTYKDVDDLCRADADATALAELVEKFVAPNQWDDSEAKIEVAGKQLAVNQTTRVHFDILIFCERLRKARGQATRTKYPSRQIHVQPRLAQLTESLERRTTFAFVDWTSLAEVFNYWQDSSGMVLLIDWNNLADQDLRPMATVAASVENTKWRDALGSCLAPLELDWVPVDGTTLRITTRDQAELDCWVEFYPGADAGKLKQAIESQADATALAGMVIADDASERFVILRGNRQVHELALAQMSN